MKSLGKKHYRTGIERIRLDNAGRDSQNTVFGEQITANRKPDILEKFQYNLPNKTTTQTGLNGGAVTHSVNVAVLSSSTATNGSAEIKSNDVIRYTPGTEAYAFFTARFLNGGVAGCKQYAGLFDNTDGYYLGYDGVNFIAGLKKDGVESNTTQKHFNLDPLDGTGASGYTLNPAMLNVYKISYGWLGVAPITWEVMAPDGTFIAFHQTKTTGLTTSPHSTNPTFPITFNVTKTSGATNVIVHTASWNCGIINEEAVVSDRFFTATVNATGATAETVLINFNNVSTFQSKANRVKVELRLLGMSSEGNKPSIIKIYKNLAITSPTWANVDSVNSVMQKDVVGTVTPNPNNLIFAFPLAKSDSVLLNVTGLDFAMNPGSTFTITGQSSVVADITFTARWAEKF